MNLVIDICKIMFPESNFNNNSAIDVLYLKMCNFGMNF